MEKIAISNTRMMMREENGQDQEPQAQSEDGEKVLSEGKEEMVLVGIDEHHRVIEDPQEGVEANRIPDHLEEL